MQTNGKHQVARSCPGRSANVQSADMARPYIKTRASACTMRFHTLRHAVGRRLLHIKGAAMHSQVWQEFWIAGDTHGRGVTPVRAPRLPVHPCLLWGRAQERTEP